MKTRMTNLVHELLAGHLRPKDKAIDATAGNGHDTLFLAKAVGGQGMVFAFDIQPEAIEQTRAKLTQEQIENVRVILAGHECMEELVPKEYLGQIAAITFNLGYRPGSDKSLVTQPETTLTAIECGLNYLKPNGLVTLVAYVGHPGGKEEANAVRNWLEKLDKKLFDWKLYESEAPQSPCTFVLRKL